MNRFYLGENDSAKWMYGMYVCWFAKEYSGGGTISSDFSEKILLFVTT